MTAIGVLNTDLSDWLGRSDFTTEDFDRINNRVASKLSLDLAPVSRTLSVQITNTPGSNAWTLPSDYLFAKSITVDDRDAFMRVAPINLIKAWNAQADVGTPQYFSIEGNSLIVSPDPGTTSTYTLNLSYIATLQSLTTSDSTNDVTVAVPHLWHHLAMYYATELMQDFQANIIHKQKYDEELNSFNISQNLKRISGSPKTTFSRSHRVP